MSKFADRIRQERERLGLNRGQFAELAGVANSSQTYYESGVRSPDADYLAAIEVAGVDVLYILTGKSSSTHPLADDENELLSSYRNLDIRGKVNALGMINSLQNTTDKVKETLKTKGITIHGSIGGGVHNIKGDIIGSIDMSVTNSAEKKKRPR